MLCFLARDPQLVTSPRTQIVLLRWTKTRTSDLYPPLAPVHLPFPEVVEISVLPDEPLDSNGPAASVLASAPYSVGPDGPDGPFRTRCETSRFALPYHQP